MPKIQNRKQFIRKKINWKNLRMILRKFTTKLGQNHGEGKEIDSEKSDENV